MDLFKVFRPHGVSQHQLVNALALNVFLQYPLVFPVCLQQLRHGDSHTAERFIVVQLGLQLVAELVIAAWLVVDLLQGELTLTVRHQIGVAAFAVAQQAQYPVGLSVYRKGFRRHGILSSISPAR